MKIAEMAYCGVSLDFAALSRTAGVPGTAPVCTNRSPVKGLQRSLARQPEQLFRMWGYPPYLTMIN